MIMIMLEIDSLHSFFGKYLLSQTILQDLRNHKRIKFTWFLSSLSLKSNGFMGDLYLQFSFRTTPPPFCNTFLPLRYPVLSWYTDCQYEHRTFPLSTPYPPN